LGLIGECTFTTSNPSSSRTASTRSGHGTPATGATCSEPRAAVSTPSGRDDSRAAGSSATQTA
jgi:hypothetical protein